MITRFDQIIGDQKNVMSHLIQATRNDQIRDRNVGAENLPKFANGELIVLTSPSGLLATSGEVYSFGFRLGKFKINSIINVKN